MASLDLGNALRSFPHDRSAADINAAHQTPTSGGRDDLDDLFNFDPEVASVFNGGATNEAEAQDNLTDAPRRQDGNAGQGLGIDEEIKIRKPRAPIAKLDEDRLLSSKGLPKLRRITKDRLRFRGKGHEFSDVSRLLNTYQLWLDDLFPKAKFADALAIIEKLGHKKRLQIMRREWIDESKLRPETDSKSDGEGDFVVRDCEDEEADGLFVGTSGDAQQNSAPAREAGSAAAGDNDEEQEWDELDALFATNTVPLKDQQTGKESFAEEGSPAQTEQHREEADFADEMEVLADMGEDPW